MSQLSEAPAPIPEDGRQDRFASIIEELNSCPYYQLLGMKIVEMGGGHARLVMPVEEKLLQIYGTVHGGATASLADSAIAVALISTSRETEKAFTVQMSLNFVAPVKDGVVTAEARLFQRGRTIVAGSVEIRDDSGKLIVTGMATYVPVKG